MYVPHGAVPDRRGFAPAIVAWQFARHLRTFAPTVISAREHYREDRAAVGGIPIRRLHEGALYRRLFRKATRLDPWPLHRRAAHIVRSEPVALFHAHQLEFPVDDFRRAVGRALPVVVHAHVTVGPFDPARGVADAYVAASQHIRDRLVDKGYPAERVTVVPNGVDTELFRPAQAGECAPLCEQLGIPSVARVVGFAGRKQEVKGFDVFLRVAEVLSQHHDDLFFVALGPEPDDARRESSYAEREHLRARLTARGRYADLPPADQAGLAALLRCVDIMLLPSRAEPQGMVMMESMASGCVTVSSNVGGIRETIEHQNTGVLLERPDDVAAALAVITRLLASPQTQTTLRRAARDAIVQRRAWPPVTAQLEALYRTLIHDD
jgi:glycosyltransferase involved in cell wall biosynthesis